MSLPLFTPPLAPSASGTLHKIMVRSRAVMFGDGYEQRAENGINSRPRGGQWQWVLDQADADTLVSFLSTNAVTGFRYTFPGDTERKWRVEGEIDIACPGGALRSVSVQVKEIFDQ